MISSRSALKVGGDSPDEEMKCPASMQCFTPVNLWCTACIIIEKSADGKNCITTKGWVSNLSVPQITELDTSGEFTPNQEQMTHLMAPGDHHWEIQDYRRPKGVRRSYGA